MERSHNCIEILQPLIYENKSIFVKTTFIKVGKNKGKYVLHIKKDAIYQSHVDFFVWEKAQWSGVCKYPLQDILFFQENLINVYSRYDNEEDIVKYIESIIDDIVKDIDYKSKQFFDDWFN